MIKDYWDRYAEVFYDLLGLLAFVILGITLGLVAKYGMATIVEHQGWILWAERWIIIPGIFGLGLWRTIKDFRNRRSI